MTRFEIKARLPEGTYIDHHPELEHDFQYVWDAIIAMWEELEWSHLPFTHIQQSMERVITFVTWTQVPNIFRCFNVDHGKKLDEDAKNFAAILSRVWDMCRKGIHKHLRQATRPPLPSTLLSN